MTHPLDWKAIKIDQEQIVDIEIVDVFQYVQQFKCIHHSNISKAFGKLTLKGTAFQKETPWIIENMHMLNGKKYSRIDQVKFVEESL